jgi:hypothetical protein
MDGKERILSLEAFEHYEENRSEYPAIADGHLHFCIARSIDLPTVSSPQRKLGPCSSTSHVASEKQVLSFLLLITYQATATSSGVAVIQWL